jgi:predicted TPR repeat methyltransferase
MGLPFPRSARLPHGLPARGGGAGCRIASAMPDPDDDSRFERAKRSFYEGLACHEAGRYEEAERHFLASLEAVPGRPSTLVNLADTQLRLGRAAPALVSADRAIAAEPDGTDGWLHRAGALQMLDRPDEALAALDRLLALDPAHVEARLRRAQALHRLGRDREALDAYDRVLADAPDHARAWTGRGGLLRERGDRAAAAEAYRNALRHGGDAEMLRYYLASVSDAPAPRHAPAPYVGALFDAYAHDFDEHLVGQLGYQAHRRLLDGLRVHAPGEFDAALDLGCGTGLCGPGLRPRVRHLVGVDLSAGMLERAAALDVYDELHALDLLDFMGRTDTRFGLVVATDVFIYVGDLAPVFAAVRRVMDGAVGGGGAGGHRTFAFSVEAVPGEAGRPAEPAGNPIGSGEDEGVHLMGSLRYAHRERYLRGLAARHGFEVVAVEPAPIRQDQRETVHGLYVTLRLPGR